MSKKINIVEKMELSKDAALDFPIVTSVGNYEIYIENFKSIILYENDTLKLLTKCGIITVQGTSLEIMYYDDEVIFIKGRISKVEYWVI